MIRSEKAKTKTHTGGTVSWQSPGYILTLNGNIQQWHEKNQSVFATMSNYAFQRNPQPTHQFSPGFGFLGCRSCYFLFLTTNTIVWKCLSVNFFLSSTATRLHLARFLNTWRCGHNIWRNNVVNKLQLKSLFWFYSTDNNCAAFAALIIPDGLTRAVNELKANLGLNFISLSHIVAVWNNSLTPCPYGVSVVVCLKPFPSDRVKLPSADHGPLTAE